ncbi:MAG TPA: hypothetical protein PLR08_04245 [bacterium]|nr:hypothetical protein [bacterium]
MNSYVQETQSGQSSLFRRGYDDAYNGRGCVFAREPEYVSGYNAGETISRNEAARSGKSPDICFR